MLAIVCNRDIATLKMICYVNVHVEPRFKGRCFVIYIHLVKVLWKLVLVSFLPPMSRKHSVGSHIQQQSFLYLAKNIKCVPL